MDRIKKTVASVLVLMFAVSAAGCSFFRKPKVTHENFIKGFTEVYDAEEADEVEDLYNVIMRYPLDKGIYYTSDDEDEADQMYDTLLNRLNHFPNYKSHKSSFGYIETHDGTMTLLFAFSFKTEEKAQKFFDELSEDVEEGNEEFKKDSKDGYKYALGHDNGYDKAGADALYMQGDTVIYIRSLVKSSEDADDLDKCIKTMGLISPYEI